MKYQALNPYLPSWEYVPDGEPHVFGDRLYIFGSHDRFGGNGYCENDYVCWSAPVNDLSDWTFHGTIYNKIQDVHNQGKSGKKIQGMAAPDVGMGPDGRYYLYYCLSVTSRISVAVSDKPEGPYDYYGEVRFPNGKPYGKGPMWSFDPAIFVDDDERIYLYDGFCLNGNFMRRFGRFPLVNGMAWSRVVELETDMLTIKGPVKKLIPGTAVEKGTSFEGHAFYEASSMRKFNGKYYMIYSSALSHELCYAMSDYPDRDFVFKGTLHSNGNIGYEGKTEADICWGNNHGSVVCINGQYYVFAHRHTNGNEHNRQGVAERLVMNQDGTFDMAEMTSCGLNQEPLRCEGTYEAGIACILHGKSGAYKYALTRNNISDPYITQDGVDREQEPGQYIANIQDGSVIGYRYFHGTGVPLQLRLTVAGTSERPAEGRLMISEKEHGEPLSVIELHAGLDRQDVICKLVLLNGPQYLYIRYLGTGALNLYKLSFSDME